VALATSIVWLSPSMSVRLIAMPFTVSEPATGPGTIWFTVTETVASPPGTDTVRKVRSAMLVVPVKVAS
jgi:hypothetical protein